MRWAPGGLCHALTVRHPLLLAAARRAVWHRPALGDARQAEKECGKVSRRLGPWAQRQVPRLQGGGPRAAAGTRCTLRGDQGARGGARAIGQRASASRAASRASSMARRAHHTDRTAARLVCLSFSPLEPRLPALEMLAVQGASGKGMSRTLGLTGARLRAMLYGIGSRARAGGKDAASGGFIRIGTHSLPFQGHHGEVGHCTCRAPWRDRPRSAPPAVQRLQTR